MNQMQERKPRFLYIDDNKDSTELFKYVAESLGIDPTICNDSPNALKYLDRHEYDAVITDLSMPVLDGLTIAEEIRLNEETRPNKQPVCIIFYTAHQVDGAIQRIAARTKVAGIYQKGTTDVHTLLECALLLCDNKKPVIVKQAEKGTARPNALVCLLSVISLIIGGTVFMWLLHRTEEEWAVKWSLMKSQRDASRASCEDNADGKTVLVIWAKQQGTEPPAEMQTTKPCGFNEEKEK